MENHKYYGIPNPSIHTSLELKSLKSHFGRNLYPILNIEIAKSAPKGVCKFLYPSFVKSTQPCVVSKYEHLLCITYEKIQARYIIGVG